MDSGPYAGLEQLTSLAIESVTQSHALNTYQGHPLNADRSLPRPLFRKGVSDFIGMGDFKIKMPPVLSKQVAFLHRIPFVFKTSVGARLYLESASHS